MCGILGYIKFDKEIRVDKCDLIRSLRMMNHRGPDDEGVWQSVDGICGLGHKRLSIIDLSPLGHQPMMSEDGNFIITYNGEIYNFKEIKEELSGSGYIFKSKSDTEVILNGYIKYGPDVINKFRGMFSLAIYNSKTKSLFFAKDRMGIKPFYYTVTRNGFYFSSEIKPLISLSGVEKKIRKESVLEYFAFGKVHSPNTMFENIYKLPAACSGTFGNNGLEISKFWTPYGSKMIFDDAETENGYRDILFNLFKESVNYRLVSDVPVGIFLSGGVDSTGILGMINHLGRSKDVYTYSAGFEAQNNYDERIYAKKAADYFGSRHFEISINKNDLVETLPSILEFIDEPVSDSTIIPIFFLSRLARENGSIVLLNGDGADELFSGYNKWLEYIRLYKYWKLIRYSPDFSKSLIGLFANTVFSEKKSQIINDIINRAKLKTQFYIGDTGALKGTGLFYDIINPEIYNLFDNNHVEFDKIKKSGDYVEWMSYWGLKSIVENVFLYRADRMGMANSIEIRVPYLDHKIVEFGMQMPQSLKYKNHTGKYLLKKALERIVPNEFLYRKKMGFCVPVKEWVGEAISSSVFPYFYKVNKELNLFDEKVISEFGRMTVTEKSETGNSLLLNLHIFTNWYRIWFG
jgi:asparagine synthase (glutamine-hydrolysing)